MAVWFGGGGATFPIWFQELGFKSPRVVNMSCQFFGLCDQIAPKGPGNWLFHIEATRVRPFAHSVRLKQRTRNSHFT